MVIPGWILLFISSLFLLLSIAGVVRRRNKKSLAALVLSGLMLAASFSAVMDPDTGGTGPDVSGTLEVHFIDVGQADSILITQKDSAMLIDGGNNEDSDLVKNYLRNEGIKKLDYVIGTHPHEDHIGGLDAVIKSFDIGSVIMPKAESDTRTFEDLIDAVIEKGLKITAPVPETEYGLGDAGFVILAPNSEEYEDLNDYSVVIKLTYGNSSFLFTGDAEEVSENEMLAKGYPIKADVLKVGHHGSDSSTGDGFLKAVSPEYAVISVGKGNSYGHPSQKTLDSLDAAGVTVYRTDEAGTIIAISDGKTISFKTAGKTEASSKLSD